MKTVLSIHEHAVVTSAANRHGMQKMNSITDSIQIPDFATRICGRLIWTAEQENLRQHD